MNNPTIKSIQNELIKRINKQITSSIESYSHTEELQGFDGIHGLIEKEPKASHTFTLSEDDLRDIIFEVLQQKTNLSPWNRAVEFIEQLKAKH